MKRKIIFDFPRLVLFKIFLFLDLKDYTKCSLVCRKWKKIFDEENFWFNHLLKENLKTEEIEEYKKKNKCDCKEMAKNFFDIQEKYIYSSKLLQKMTTSEIFTSKIIFLGDAFVGKTSLIRRFSAGLFDENNLCTISAAFLTKKIHWEEKVINLQIWDTSGKTFVIICLNFIKSKK